MTPDLNQYRHHLDEFEIPEVAKAELIQTICLAMQGFVDAAFGLDPTQICMGANHADQASSSFDEQKDRRAC